MCGALWGGFQTRPYKPRPEFVTVPDQRRTTSRDTSETMEGPVHALVLRCIRDTRPGCLSAHAAKPGHDESISSGML